ncbi:MAG TPA: peptidoglycan DD-metalloendopeptidase family protein [Holophagaceae bacterium]|nr:peptidoglycan DD-metalloendopeptidase family protein [Holophagaceae bacterium]
MLIPLALSLLAAPASAGLPFRPSPVPGGVAVVPLPPSPRAPEVRYHGERVLVRKRAGGWTAVVGIKLSAQPGLDQLEVDGRSVPFRVKSKHYPEQRITLENKHQVNPDAEDEKRIAREQALMAPVWKDWSVELVPSLRFQQPTPGRLTASFGMRRIFNGEPRAPHPGLDIAAPMGQAVNAPAEGVVMLTGDFFFSGNTVLLAHGEGVVSLLCHLTDITVKEGQHLQAGDLLGHVGKTGRATGPHLHWTLSLNNARVDPGLFIP